MNRETELSLLLGMAHGLANSFNHEFGPGQREIMDRIDKGIEKLFYQQPPVSPTTLPSNIHLGFNSRNLCVHGTPVGTQCLQCLSMVQC